jgi:hypothetical protein
MKNSCTCPPSEAPSPAAAGCPAQVFLPLPPAHLARDATGSTAGARESERRMGGNVLNLIVCTFMACCKPAANSLMNRIPSLNKDVFCSCSHYVYLAPFMSSRVKLVFRLVLAAVFAWCIYYLPRFFLGSVSIHERDGDEPNMALFPGRQIIGLRMEYGKKLNVAITRMTPHTDYEVRLSYPASVSRPILSGLTWLPFV